MNLAQQGDQARQSELAAKYATPLRRLRPAPVTVEIITLVADHLGDPNYAPANLVDHLKTHFGARNDGQLALQLRIEPPVISKLRRKVQALTAGLLLRMYDRTGIPIEQLRELAGLKAPVDMQRAPFGGGAAVDAELVD